MKKCSLLVSIASPGRCYSLHLVLRVLSLSAHVWSFRSLRSDHQECLLGNNNFSSSRKESTSEGEDEFEGKERSRRRVSGGGSDSEEGFVP